MVSILIKTYPLSSRATYDQIKWCMDNCKGIWDKKPVENDGIHWTFNSSEDAVLFVVHWKTQ